MGGGCAEKRVTRNFYLIIYFNWRLEVNEFREKLIFPGQIWKKWKLKYAISPFSKLKCILLKLMRFRTLIPENFHKIYLIGKLMSHSMEFKFNSTTKYPPHPTSSCVKFVIHKWNHFYFKHTNNTWHLLHKTIFDLRPTIYYITCGTDPI